MEYSKSSNLTERRVAIQRHLRVLKRPFHIFTDEAFSSSNEVLNTLLKQKKGRSSSSGEAQITDLARRHDKTCRLIRRRALLRRPSKVKLTQYCWFEITIHFCLHGEELQSTLKKTDIVIDEEQGVTLFA